jgi:hypothetical protein
MEPIQEKATHMITPLEEKKKNMVQAQEKCAVMIREEITMQALEALADKTAQVQARGRELADKFHSLAEVVEEACTA